MATQKHVTIRDVAKLAGVSIGTVSRVMNKAANVEPSLVERVMNAAKSLDYHPDIGARSMRSRQTRIIGVLIPDFQNPLASAAVAGIEEQLSELGYTIFLANSRYDRKREERVFQEFVQRRVDGIIAMVASDQDTETAEQLKTLPVPIVLLERETSLDINMVRTNQHDGAYRATRYLIGMGHKRIALLSVPPTTFSGRARLSGYRQAILDGGLTLDESLILTDGYRLEHSLNAIYTVLALSWRPTAVIASGGLLGAALEASRQLHLKIPEQLSVVSLGDTDLAAMMTPAITAVSYDWEEAGKVAAHQIMRLIGGERELRETQIVPSKFIIRQSCCPPAPAGDPQSPGKPQVSSGG